MKKQARNAASSERGNIKIIKQMIQQILPKYIGTKRENQLPLPKVGFGTHKKKKRAKSEFTGRPLTFTAQEYCKLVRRIRT